VIIVADTGHGMSAAIRQRVFEPFFTTKPPGEGTGLGLSVSYGIIQAHKGTISVESTPDVGTTFTISLPLVEDSR
jgi:signal transduction histidine kinase